MMYEYIVTPKVAIDINVKVKSIPVYENPHILINTKKLAAQLNDYGPKCGVIAPAPVPVPTPVPVPVPTPVPVPAPTPANWRNRLERFHYKQETYTIYYVVDATEMRVKVRTRNGAFLDKSYTTTGRAVGAIKRMVSNDNRYYKDNTNFYVVPVNYTGYTRYQVQYEV